MSRNITDGVKSGTLCVVLTSSVALNAPATLVANVAFRTVVVFDALR